MDKLKELLTRGPDPTRGLRGLALSRYHDIAQARRQLWRWREIAESLDLLPTQGAALGEAFSRVARRIAEGKLEPPAPATAAGGNARPSPVTKAGISTDAAKSEAASAQPQERKGFKRIDVDKLNKQEGESHGK